MFERAMSGIIVTAAASAAVALAVFASGFALYALAQPEFGPAGAAAIVALTAALLVGLYALFVTLRKRRRERERERESAVAQAELLDELPLGLGDIARDRPLVTLAVTALAGLLAARHPTLTRDLIHIVARFGRR